MNQAARHLTIITGASRGLGRAMAQHRLARGDCVLAIARAATTLTVPDGAMLVAWQADLSDPLDFTSWLQQWLDDQGPHRYQSATLINNAGMTGDPSPLSAVPAAALSAAMRVNLEAPLLLTGAFLQATAEWSVPRKVLLISSGLGRRAMAGSAAYNASKAGLDHLARSVALEEATKSNGARIVSLAPGVIDTDMQLQLRSADAQAFRERQRFVDLKANGQLDSPEQAAAKVLAVLDRADFGHEPVTDVRQA